MDTRGASGVARSIFGSARDMGAHPNSLGRENRPLCASERVVLCRILEMDF